jgi:hypothetical protein
MRASMAPPFNATGSGLVTGCAWQAGAPETQPGEANDAKTGLGARSFPVEPPFDTTRATPQSRGSDQPLRQYEFSTYQRALLL